MTFGPLAALAVVLSAALAMVPAGPAGPRGPTIGLEMPAGGIDGAEGLAVGIAVRLGALPVIARDSAQGGFLNPHQDEGVDNDVDVRTAPASIAGFAADPHVIAAIGGLRRRVGDADAVAGQARRLPAIVLARWSRNDKNGDAYCVCVSPGKLVDFARAAARERFGARLLVVLVGDAAALEPMWKGRWGAGATANVRDDGAGIEFARRRARAVNAVLVLADERPPTLWRGDAFARAFDVDYVRFLGHRDFQLIPATAPAGSVLTIETRFAPSAARAAFERRFHAVAGYLPGDAATRAFAAAQVVAQAGLTREQTRRALRSRSFTTIVGTLTFDGDGFALPYPLALTTPARAER
ncbi:MAG: hypothetical protein ABSB70_07430 [Candidatus Velthaea sp.]|jgi:hypothetical protein